MPEPLHILVLCTGNSARSILGEAILQREGHGRIRVFSAGSKPKGEPNPFALKLLAAEGYDIAGFRSKSWDMFSAKGAPRIDVAITVCDSAAGESCPVFFGAPLRVHWGLDDPADVEGPDAVKEAAFRRTYGELMLRAEALAALPFETMASADLRAALTEIGRMEGATSMAKDGVVKA
jgi:arsenate reductase (thioredoxin)